MRWQFTFRNHSSQPNHSYRKLVHSRRSWHDDERGTSHDDDVDDVRHSSCQLRHNRSLARKPVHIPVHILERKLERKLVRNSHGAPSDGDDRNDDDHRSCQLHRNRSSVQRRNRRLEPHRNRKLERHRNHSHDYDDGTGQRQPKPMRRTWSQQLQQAQTNELAFSFLVI